MIIARIVLAVLFALPLAAAPATKLRVTVPDSVVYKYPFNFTVEAIDDGGNVDTGYTGTVRITSTDAYAFLPPDTTFTAADAGVRTFTATLNLGGPHVITAEDTAVSSIRGSDSTSSDPAPGYTVWFVIDVPPNVAGQPLDITVRTQDYFHQTVHGYTGTVQLEVESVPPLPPYTFTAEDAGVHTFTVTPSQEGKLQIFVYDLSNETIQALRTTPLDCDEFTLAATQAGPACHPWPVELRAEASHSATFWWTGPNRFEAFGNAVTTTRGGTYHVQATGPDGCTKTVSIDVEFGRPAFEFAGGPQSMCSQSERVVRLATPLTNIEWTITNGVVVSGQGTQTPTIRAGEPMAGYADMVLRVSGFDPESGCTFTNYVMAESDVLPLPSATIHTDTGALCTGETRSASADPDPGWIYVWSIENGTITSRNNHQITYVAGGTGPVVLGLTVHAGPCPVSAETTIPVADASAVVDSTPRSVCSGDSVSIPVALSGQPPFRLTWSDGVVVSDIPTHAYTRTVMATGDVTLSVTKVENAQCDNGTASGAAAIDVVESVRIEEQPEGGRIQRGERFGLDVVSPGATSWQWYEGESGDTSRPIDGATADSYVTPPLTRTTSFWVRATGTCGYEDSIAAEVEVIRRGPNKRRAVGRR